MNFSAQYLKQTIQIAEFLDDNIIEKMADSISEIKSSGGRLFLLDLEEVQDMLVMLFVILENIKFRMLYAI